MRATTSTFKGRLPLLRFVSLFALLCLVPLALLTYFTIHMTDHTVVHQVKARVKATSAVAALLVQKQMAGVASQTASYASRPLLIKALADGDPARFDSDAISQQLTQLKASQPGFGTVFITDTSCRLVQIEPADPGIVGVDLSTRDWCAGVKAPGQPYVSEAFETTVAGHPLAVVAAAMVRQTIGDDRSRPLGIVAVVYNLDGLRASAEQVANAQGTDLIITDQRGTVIAGGTRDPAGKGLTSAAADPRVHSALAGRSGVVRSTTAQGDSLSGFAPVQAIGWTVTAEIPASKALAGVRRLRSAVLIVTGPLGLLLAAGIVLLARTLRSRQDAERTLEEREANTRSILGAATDAFVSMDAFGTIRAWNAQACSIFGWTEAEAVGRRLSNTIIPPHLRAQHERGLAHFLDTEEGPVLNQRIEITAMHRRGHEFPVELAIWPVRSRDGWSFNAFVNDITERKRTEADLAMARDHAVETSRLKSEFLANMSHEIRTPMNGVLGMTSMLLETDLMVDQRGFAETVLASGEALLGIINDILDFSKMDAGRLDLESIDFDLRALIEDVAALLGPTAHSKGIELACSLPVEMPNTVQGDPGRLRQILTNLVGNALKFTPSGEVVLEMTMTTGEDGTALWCFQVKDTGIGISATDQAAVFDSFSQADAGTTRRYGGTGLGLAISRQLVRLMGGQIGVKSEVGVGSTFWFTLGLQVVETGPPPAPVTSLAGLHALIVDENATCRAILTRHLQAWGMRSEGIAGAAQAKEAMAASAAAGDPFDVALVGLKAQDGDGTALARSIGADPTTPAVGMVLLASSGQRADADEAREAGILCYLTKPVRQSQLHDCLAAVAAPSPTADATAPPTRPRPPTAGLSGHILLAEDNPVNQQVGKAMLENLGFRVDVVADGAEAVRSATMTPYRAILMDCQMPVLDGYQAARQIRRLQAGSHRTPIVAVTASAMQSDQDRCLAAGMDDYLAKPLRLKALAEVLARWAPDPSGPSTTVEVAQVDFPRVDAR